LTSKGPSFTHEPGTKIQFSSKHEIHMRQGPKFNITELAGAARTRTPSTTNYDVHSPTWGDGRSAHPPSAMWATDPGHGP